MIYADIIIDISSDKLDRSFQYCVPAHLEQEIKLGMVVSIPFGNSNQLRKGYVTGLSQEAKVDPSILKEIAGCCSAEETTESRLIALAAWMKENYGSTMIQALKTVLPIKEKIRAKEKRYLSLSISEEKAAEILAQLEKTRFKARTRLLRELLQEKRLDYTTASRELGVAASVVKTTASYHGAGERSPMYSGGMEECQAPSRASGGSYRKRQNTGIYETH